MNFIRRWRHGAERQHEQLLVKLWTINTMDADDTLHGPPQPAKLALAAKTELRSSLKYLSTSEVENTIASTVSESAYQQQVLHNLRRQINHNRPR
jgi:hypothetical protein